ncbi:L-2-hydroxyglutarate dehydrogenase [Fusarium oxysporum f. sp. albedinis]|nr:L-2-hydroxyglutarate dehydrogenase [Fusarium oxysporum f. sp. albedinis]
MQLAFSFIPGIEQPHTLYTHTTLRIANVILLAQYAIIKFTRLQGYSGQVGSIDYPSSIINANHETESILRLNPHKTLNYSNVVCLALLLTTASGSLLLPWIFPFRPLSFSLWKRGVRVLALASQSWVFWAARAQPQPPPIAPNQASSTFFSEPFNLH